MQHTARLRACSYSWFSLLYVQLTSIRTLTVTFPPSLTGNGHIGQTVSQRNSLYSTSIRSVCILPRWSGRGHTHPDHSPSSLLLILLSIGLFSLFLRSIFSFLEWAGEALKRHARDSDDDEAIEVLSFSSVSWVDRLVLVALGQSSWWKNCSCDRHDLF